MAKRGAGGRRKGVRGGLTEQQRIFVAEYVRLRNATAAAKRAGYGEAGAAVSGYRLLKQAKIQSAVDAGVKKLEEKANISIEECMVELARVAKLDPADCYDDNNRILPLSSMPVEARVCISELVSEELNEMTRDGAVQVGDVRKVKFHDKLKAIDTIFKKLGAYAPQKIEVTDGLAEQLRKARERAAAKDDGDDDEG